MGLALAPRVVGLGREFGRERVSAFPATPPVDPARDGTVALSHYLVVEGDGEAEDLRSCGIDRPFARFPEVWVVAPVRDGALESHKEVETGFAVPVDFAFDSPQRPTHVFLAPGEKEGVEQAQRRDPPSMPKGEDDESSPPPG